jgi:acyl-coenzyme A synthetase/AMP-(fatty) acid ligase
LSILDRIYEWARGQPHKPALIHNGVPCSYAQFACRIEAVRRSLQTHDLPAGAEALIIIQDALDAWANLLALRSFGLTTACLVDWNMARAFQGREVACIVSTKDQFSRMPPALDVGGSAKRIVAPDPLAGEISLENLRASADRTSSAGGHILVTSGTSGIYKKVLISDALEDRRNLERARCTFVERHSVQNNLDFPIWTGAGYKDPPIHWHLGATVIIDQRPGRLARLFDHRPTRAFLTPAHLVEALQIFRNRDATTEPPCIISISSGQASANALRGALKHLSTFILNNWSATELMTFPLASRVRTLDDMLWLGVVNDRVVEVVDQDGSPCPVGVEGELRIQTLDIDGASYLDDAEAAKRHFRHGYFYPGDLAVRRADGKFRILGRASDVLNIGGVKLPVGPLEERAQRILGVDHVCLFGVVSDSGADELIVAIEGDQLPQRELLDRLAKRFDAFERVRFEVLTEFPRTETGMRKVRRAELRKIVAGRATPR